MLLHRCKCGILIPQELRLCPDCEAKESDKMSRHMEYNLRRRNKKAAAFYVSAEWRKVRAFALSLYDSLDIVRVLCPSCHIKTVQTPVLCAIPPTHRKPLLSYFFGADCIPYALTSCRFPSLRSPDTGVIPAVSISRICICVIALCTTFFRAIYTPHAGIFVDARCSVQKGVEMAIKKRLHTSVQSLLATFHAISLHLSSHH